VGTIAVWTLGRVPYEKWDQTRVGDVCDPGIAKITPQTDVMEALRLLTREDSRQVLIITDEAGALQGVVTKTDILRSF
jgi:predicted transcriptional regulator